MAAVQPGQIKLVAGLGNPGAEYATTRHNAGFRSIDALAAELGVSYWKNQCGAEVALVKVVCTDGPREIVLAKPQSFMNTSGGPISKLCREYSVEVNELLVIHDELDIPESDVRVKVGGGHAGHNGLKSIIEKCGSRDFTRIRVGIGAPPGRMSVVDWVLKEYRGADLEAFDVTCADAAAAAALAVKQGVIYARDHVNGAGKPGAR